MTETPTHPLSGLKPLPRKQSPSTSQEHWEQVWRRFLDNPDHGRADELIDQTVKRVTDRLALPVSGDDARPLVGWSGGKDSIALEIITTQAGVHDKLLVLSALELPSFVQWVQENAPDRLTIHTRENINHDWLRDHPGMLFPTKAADAAKWFRLVQHTGQRKHMAATGANLLLMGRRRADGNFCGTTSPAGGTEYVDKGGFTRYCPIADWSHEDTLNVIASRYGERALAPIYTLPGGFLAGTGPWAARQGLSSHEEGWDLLCREERPVVLTAADAGIPGAAEALTRNP